MDAEKEWRGYENKLQVSGLKFKDPHTWNFEPGICFNHLVKI